VTTTRDKSIALMEAAQMERGDIKQSTQVVLEQLESFLRNGKWMAENCTYHGDNVVTVGISLALRLTQAEMSYIQRRYKAKGWETVIVMWTEDDKRTNFLFREGPLPYKV
jgi:hypothetical protein